MLLHKISEGVELAESPNFELVKLSVRHTVPQILGRPAGQLCVRHIIKHCNVAYLVFLFGGRSQHDVHTSHFMHALHEFLFIVFTRPD